MFKIPCALIAIVFGILVSIWVQSMAVQKLLQLDEFRATLKNIVHEALEEERPKLLKEIERLHQTPEHCCNKLKGYSELYTTATEDSQPADISKHPEAVDHFKTVDHSEASRLSHIHDSLNSQTEPKEVSNVKKRRFGLRTVLRRDDERECLSQALQANIVCLVDRLQVNVSDLPDHLITAGHMTEDECQMLRNDITSRKDQVRYLVSRTKCRDISDIELFLQLIEREIPDVVAKIRAKFEENKRNNVRCATCALCQCSNNIDIKDVADILWSARAVSDGFYNEVIGCTKPRGSQENLWKALVDICNSKGNKERKKMYGMLFDFIRKKGNFEFIIKPLSGMLDRDGHLQCHCHPGLKSKGSVDVLSSCSPGSSVSEGSCSQSSVSCDFDYTQEKVNVEERIGNGGDGGNMKIRKLERQAAIDKCHLEETRPNH